MSDYVEEQIVRHEWTGNVDNISYGKLLVRCKDCKFWYKDECSHVCKITGDLHPANWFCADGERKEGR